MASESKQKNIYEKLLSIQISLNCPKNLYNKFGNYYYRSAEGIMDGIKPLLKENRCTLFISDSLEVIGERYYIKATAILLDIDSNNKIETTGYAREEEAKKGMDGSQVTGASSSYARKYALNALFLIDDVKDSDSTNTHGKESTTNHQKNTSDKNVIKIPITKTDQMSKQLDELSICKSKIKALITVLIEKNFDKQIIQDIIKKINGEVTYSSIKDVKKATEILVELEKLKK